MCGDDLSDGIGIDEAAEENKRHEMVVQDFRIEVEVGRNESPGNGERDKANECIAGFITFGTAGFDYVQRSGRPPRLKLE
jgi:hypothetical protein